MAGITKEERAKREAAMADATEVEVKIEYVQMVRDEEKYPAPHSAQVHPDEVLNYQLGGWVVKPAE